MIMGYCKKFGISLFTAALAVCLTAGIVLGDEYDYLGGGYVSSHDRSMAFEPGVAGMVRWLDQPVTNLPWYSSDLTFYRNAVPSSTFSIYREYYTTPVTSQVGGGVSSPVQLAATSKTPYAVYYGNGKGLPYSQYASSVSAGTNDLWISGATNWTQYAAIPLGASLKLVANVSTSGMGGFYEVVQAETVETVYKTYTFNTGQNAMDFKAERTGRHMLYFVVNSLPSNVVIVDVLSQSN
jgi:hypothetical protein